MRYGLVQLGIPQEKAELKIEKIEELKGYVGKEISRLAIKQGYDAIFQYFNGALREIVIWNSRIVKPVIDQGLDIDKTSTNLKFGS